MYAEKASTIRYPSTANLMIDSADRVNPATGSYAGQPSAFNFQISRSNSIFNGFFTRIATTEVVLEWSEPNVRWDLSNNFINIGTAAVPNRAVYLPGMSSNSGAGFYNVAQVLDAIVLAANALGTIGAWSVDKVNYPMPTLISTVAFNIPDCPLARQLTLITSPSIRTTFNIVRDPDLRQFRYIDFVSAQLTYNQDLKDSSTAPIVQDVLCRWYFSYDNQTLYDKYNYPIEMGYNAFVIRRLFNPPKQIRWSPEQPLGNIAFQVYSDNGALVNQFSTPSTRAPSGILLYNTNWLMTLQISEV